jgi:hypothetical protein
VVKLGRKILVVLVAGMAAVVLGMAFLGSGPRPSGEGPGSTQAQGNASLEPEGSDSGDSSEVKGMPYLPYAPIMGESISMDRALELSPFPIVFPEIVLDDVALVDIRHYTVGEARHYFILIYSASKLPSNPNLWDLLHVGGMIVIEGQHGFSGDYVSGLIEETERGEVPGKVVETVNDRDIIMVEGDLKHEAVLYIDEIILDVVTGPSTSMDELRAVMSSITTLIED